MSRIKFGFCPVSEKVKYLNRKQAEDFILENKYPLRAYHCPDCDYFHLTGRMTNSKDRLVKPAISRKGMKRKGKPQRY